MIAKLDPKENGKISTVAFIYIVLFNILGASIGTAAAVAIGPGKKKKTLNTCTSRAICGLCVS